MKNARTSNGRFGGRFCRVSWIAALLKLNAARQGAVELGFLTVPEFVSLTQSTLNTIELLEKFRGHLYNWYDTLTLKPLVADSFVSSVDSGNFVASLLTLHVGALDLLERLVVFRRARGSKADRAGRERKSRQIAHSHANTSRCWLSNLHKRAGTLQVVVYDRVCRPIG